VVVEAAAMQEENAPDNLPDVAQNIPQEVHTSPSAGSETEAPPAYEAAPGLDSLEQPVPRSVEPTEVSTERNSTKTLKFVAFGLGTVVLLSVIGWVVLFANKKVDLPPQASSQMSPPGATQAAGPQTVVPSVPTIGPPTTQVAAIPAGGPSQADVGFITKTTLNEFLQLSSDENWNAIDERVRVLKVVLYDGGDRTRARELNKVAMDLMAKSDFAGAIVELEKAVVADRNDSEIRNNLGFAELRGGKFDAAVGSLLNTLLSEPTRGAAWLNVAEAFAELDKTAAADSALKLAIHFSQNQPRALEYLRREESQSHNHKFRSSIQRVQQRATSIPPFAR